MAIAHRASRAWSARRIMKQILRSVHEQTNESELSYLERECAVILPEVYKNFLLANNGGVASSSDSRFGDALFFCVRDLELEILDVQVGSRIPIGMDLNEDRIFLDIKTEEVYLLEKSVARSFRDFAEMLTK